MTNPYQAHSATSAAAAQDTGNRQAQRSRILSLLYFSGKDGMTGDQVSALMGIQNGTASARLVGLERNGDIVKTLKTRKTRSNKDAFVYVHRNWFQEDLGRAPVKNIAVYTSVKPYPMPTVKESGGYKTFSNDKQTNLFVELCRAKGLSIGQMSQAASLINLIYTEDECIITDKHSI